MSTIVITPTHIASDHAMVYKTHPIKTVVNGEMKKIFIDPERKFIIACTGQYDQDLTEDVINRTLLTGLVKTILKNFSSGNGNAGDHNEQMTLDEGLLLEVYQKLFGYAGRVFVVTRRERFILYGSVLNEGCKVIRLGDYCSDGSSMGYATGLLEGGMSIAEIWPVLHRLDPLTSEAHTIIPLSILEDWEEMYTEAKA